MTESTPGWYLDPINRRRMRYWDGQKWTDTTSGSGPATWPLGARVVGGLGLIIAVTLVAIALVSATGGSDAATAVPPQVSTTPTSAENGHEAEPRAVVAPDGWITTTSKGGSFSFAYDPSWTSVDQEPLDGDEPTDWGGAWLTSPPDRTGRTVVTPQAYSDGAPIASHLDSYDAADLVSEGTFTSAHGDAVHYALFQVGPGYETHYEGLYFFGDGDTFVEVRLVSDEWHGEFAEPVTALVNSIVINHHPRQLAPTSAVPWRGAAR